MVSLVIHTNKDIYTCDEIIEGTITCNVLSSLMVYGVVVGLSGHELIELNKFVPLKKRSILNDFQVLVGKEIKGRPDGSPNLEYASHQDSIKLDQQSSSWNFSFKIPSIIPSSIQFLKAEIKYQIKAYVIPVFGKQIIVEKPIKISGKLGRDDLMLMNDVNDRYKYTSEGSYYFTHMMDPSVKNDIKVSARVDKPITFIGDTLKISIDLYLNNSMKNKRIKVITAKLRQFTSFDKISDIRTISKAKHVDHERMLTCGVHQLELTIPLTNPTLQPTVNSKFIKCNQFIQIVIPTQMSEQINLKVPISVQLLPPTITNLPIPTVTSTPKSESDHGHTFKSNSSNSHSNTESQSESEPSSRSRSSSRSSSYFNTSSPQPLSRSSLKAESDDNNNIRKDLEIVKLLSLSQSGSGSASSVTSNSVSDSIFYIPSS